MGYLIIKTNNRKRINGLDKAVPELVTTAMAKTKDALTSTLIC